MRAVLKVILGIIPLCLLLGIALVLFYLQPVTSSGVVDVNIPKGSSLKNVSKILQDSGVIKNAIAFEIFVRIKGEDRGIKAGLYELQLPILPSDLLKKLVKGDVKLIRITIPEGLTIKDMDALLADRKIIERGELIRLGDSPDFARQKGVEANSLEGFLFPDTYLIKYNVTVEELVDVMLKRFWDVFDSNLKKEAADKNMSVLEVVTLASLIEKETAVGGERPLISAVFHSRLKLGMKLQSDPTVIYGLDNFDGNLTKDDLKNPHPYNTYVNNGLPPGPICNPGKASIIAALRPADVNYLYFVSKGDGTHYFSSEHSEHWQAVLKYQKHRY